MLTLARNTTSWQLILADLALILFLVSAAALTSGRGVEGLEERTIAQADAVTRHSLAPAQARRMAATASALGVRSRVVIQEGSSDAVHASLGYDQPAL